MTEKKEKQTPAPVKKTAHDWAKETGHFIPRKNNRPESRDMHTPAFSGADVLYGWSHQAYHFQGEPFLISLADFESAMRAASKFPTIKPHAPAVAPILGDKYAAFKPLKAHKD